MVKKKINFTKPEMPLQMKTKIRNISQKCKQNIDSSKISSFNTLPFEISNSNIYNLVKQSS